MPADCNDIRGAYVSRDRIDIKLSARWNVSTIYLLNNPCQKCGGSVPNFKNFRKFFEASPKWGKEKKKILEFRKFLNDEYNWREEKRRRRIWYNLANIPHGRWRKGAQENGGARVCSVYASICVLWFISRHEFVITNLSLVIRTVLFTTVRDSERRTLAISLPLPPPPFFSSFSPFFFPLFPFLLLVRLFHQRIFPLRETYKPAR